MKHTRLIVIAVSIVALAVAGFWLMKNRERRWKAEYVRMLNGEDTISSITFVGQQKRIVIDDQNIIHDFENAFRTGRTNPPRTGLSYEVDIVLKTGTKIKSELYMYDDRKGFAMADYTRVGAGDPMIVNAEFGSTSCEGTTNLIIKLLTEGKVVNQ
jgi:hypothetical protein